MKHLRRYRLEWTVLTPLHVGAGQSELRAHDEEDASEVALIARDHAGKPWIPGSTIKGALGATCTDVKVRLFGKPHEKGSQQARGTLTFSGARYVSKAGSSASFELAQTSVAVGTGVAAANKLYRRDFVPEGVTFTSDIDVESGDEPTVQADCAALETLLALAASSEGLNLGANKADDLGRLQITRIERAESRFGPTGWTAQTFAPHTIAASAPVRAPLFGLRMVCPGPFLSKGGQTDNETQPLMDAAGKAPRIMGTAVSGALRKRAEWLWALHLHRGGGAEMKSCKTSAGPRDLDPVQRLFGYEGRRGLLQVSPRNVSAKGSCQIPGVSLDAMTAAPRDGLLFFYHAHHGVTFDLSISTRADLDAAETNLFDLLKADLEANGLKLGMGTTKGFGWFCSDQDPILKHYSEKQTEALKLKSKEDPADHYAEAELPSNLVTIPYRLSRIDPNVIQLPEQRVSDRFSNHALLSKPMPAAASGHIDLVWHVETPVLVAAQTHDHTKPPKDVPFQKIGDTFAIPGSTIKGMLRAELERRVNARAYRIIENLLAITDDPEAERPHLDAKKQLAAFKAHRPDVNENYTPDFAEALFGFVREPESDDKSRSRHEALHLKARISCGMAWLVSEYDADKSRDELYVIAAAEPRPISKFYDHFGRKAYLVDNASAADVVARLKAAERKLDKYASPLKLLHPKQGQNLLFAQRIYLHNMTEAGIGAFLTVLTLDFTLRNRFLIGRARAFNAGKCFPAKIKLTLTPNDAGADYPARGGSKADMRMIGQSATPFLSAFGKFVNSGEDPSTARDPALARSMGFAAKEFNAAHDPLFGDYLRKRSRLDDGKIYYQQTSDDPKNRNFSASDRQKAFEANNGRLAAVLKKTWRD